MFGISRAEFEAALRSLRDDIARFAAQIERGSTVQLRADLDNLTGRVESIAKSMQKQFGALYVERRPKEPSSTALIAQALNEPRPGDEADGELAEVIEHQRLFARAPDGERH